MRLDKYLSDCGYGTRREVKQLIRDGRVKVNDSVVTKDGFAVNEKKDIVLFDHEAVRYQANIYLMLHKPQGYLSANEDTRYATVFDLIPEYAHRNMFCVGRLDKDTEGLLLICDDGALAHRLLSPRHHVSKQYLVHLIVPISDADMARVCNRIVLEDGTECLPANMSRLDEDKVIIEIFEGKFHQVKRMFKMVNNEVTYLKRLSMGSLRLDEALPVGKYRELYDDELAALKMD